MDQFVTSGVWAAQQRICGVYFITVWKLACQNNKTTDSFVSHLSGNLPTTYRSVTEFNIIQNKRK